MWSPEQISNLIEVSTALIGGITLMLKQMHNNKEERLESNTHLANSVPKDVAHRLLDQTEQSQIDAQANHQVSQQTGTTLEVKPPAEIEVKEGTPAIESNLSSPS